MRVKTFHHRDAEKINIWMQKAELQVGKYDVPNAALPSHSASMEFVWPDGRGKNLQSAGVLNADGCVFIASKNKKLKTENPKTVKHIGETMRVKQF
jgi:hypothetical protein